MTANIFIITIWLFRPLPKGNKLPFFLLHASGHARIRSKAVRTCLTTALVIPINLFCNIAVQILKIKTMKIQVRTNPVFEEIEITLPVYRKTGHVRCHFVKVYSEFECMWVTVSCDPSISICSAKLALYEEYVECTKEEYEQAFEEVQTKLNLLK